ncbi:MAG: S8 family serine peptidase [Anaerolineae bacterium]
MEENNHISTSEEAPQVQGCLTVGLGSSLLLWVMIAPAALTLGAEALVAASGWHSALTVLGNAILSVAPALLIAHLARRRKQHTLAATGTAVAIVGGAMTLDATAQAISPGTPNVTAALRLLLLLPYVALIVHFTPAFHPSLTRLDRANLWLSLSVAALLTLPWPLTGALGDSLASLGLLLQAAADAIPLLLLIWGLSFPLLTAAYDQSWLAALATIWLYEAALVGGVLPAGDWNALLRALFALPLALLLTELRARGRGIWPLLPAAFLYVATPRLFTDPRDVIGQGIPEVQHLLAYGIMWLTTFVFGLGLFVGRKFFTRQPTSLEEEPRPRKSIGWIPAVLWATWLLVYVMLGNPGFTNDGFLIILEKQADVSDAYTMTDRVQRLTYVRETLIQTAERTQVPLRAEIDRLGLPYRPYYIINMIRVEGHTWRMRHFEQQPGVAEVIRNPNVREYPYRIPFPAYGPSTPITGTQPNLLAIRADKAWALGATGAGIVVAGQDTGYDWEHPALKAHYRGWNGESATHDYHWLDTWDASSEPFDDGSHGTHTMGTVLGDDGGNNRIGVAPQAQWIGCRNMRRGLGNPGTYAACMEFFLGPYPLGGDPFTDGDVHYAPHLVNNSWGCPRQEGCLPDTLQPAVEALRAAGIMMVVSAGNDGPACKTTNTPPANYDAAFSVGATDNHGEITVFSSRGPVDSLLKPDIVAPGLEIRSSVPDGRYATAAGTSMAGPHVAGAVALLWSTNPTLVGEIAATERLLCETARPQPVDNTCETADTSTDQPLLTEMGMEMAPACACGGVTGTPNNVYGCGLLDAGAAVRAALSD